MKKLFLLSILFVLLSSCNLPVERIEYEQKLVVFMNLKADFPISLDTLSLNLSHEIDETHEGNETWVSNASVKIIVNPQSDSSILSLSEVDGLPGHYVVNDQEIITQSGNTYRLEIIAEEHSIFAETIIPASIDLNSVQIDNLWECEGNTIVDSINLHQDENDLITVGMVINSGNLSLLTVDTVVYKTANCYTASFTSMPFFGLGWTSEELPGMLRTTTYALEDTFSNAIIDTSFSAHAFKGHMLLDEDGNKYWPNPIVWNFNVEEMYYGWLAFNYYGYNMIIIEATDDAFSNYYSGDPMQMNQYTMPNSNIDGGFGLFSSTSSSFFFVYIKPEVGL
ncbi:MAG: DUF4249 family protein [Candidatus Marinimicrobia bacterium]|nr:DUF4249 family protein [Candidatus Neomarinimicrobiota bacterium]